MKALKLTLRIIRLLKIKFHINLEIKNEKYELIVNK